MTPGRQCSRRRADGELLYSYALVIDTAGAEHKRSALACVGTMLVVRVRAATPYPSHRKSFWMRSQISSHPLLSFRRIIGATYQGGDRKSLHPLWRVGV